MAPSVPTPEGLRLPASPLVAAVDQAAADRHVSVSDLLGNTGQKLYARVRAAGTATLDQIEDTCDRLGCHPYELYGPAYQRLAIAAASGLLEPEATVTAWHQATCARAGCAQPIQPGEPVGLVADVGPCCGACCGLDHPAAPERADATATATTPPPRKEEAA
jgi:hypothetical protein